MSGIKTGVKRIDIKLNLGKFFKVFEKDFKGKEKTVKCLCIPIDENDIFVGEKGYYLNLVAWKVKSEYGTHAIKPSYSKEKRDKMTEEEIKALPFVGNANVISVDTGNTPKDVGLEDGDGADDDLPF